MKMDRFKASEIRLFEVVIVSILAFAAAIALLPEVAHAAEITLKWDANSEPDLAGYRVHYGVYSRSYSETADVGDATTCTISSLSAGETYYFAATAYDTEGLESEFSAEISVTIPAFTIETGSVSIDQDWVRVNFQKTYSNPVVIANAASLKDDDPAVIRIRNLDKNGFEIRVQEWDYLDDMHAHETVGYLVMEAGQYTLSDGTRIEAGWFETSKTDSFESVKFDTIFPGPPVVATTISSCYGSDPVTGRIRGINSDGFNYCMQEQEANSQDHANEIIDYVAWEPSSGQLDNMVFEIAKTPDVIRDRFQIIAFSQSHADQPVFIAGMQTSDGMDTANVRWRNLQPDSIEIQIDEEQSKDAEVYHTSEIVGYMVFGRLDSIDDQIILEADFNVSKDGFAYMRDAFDYASRRGYDAGERIASGGVTGGALKVTLGGSDDADVFDMSGGWQHDFSLEDDVEVVLSFNYKLTQSPDYESDEVSRVLVSVDDVLYGQGTKDYIAQIVGDGNGGSSRSTGWQDVEVNLGRLPAGTYSLIIGGYNSKKTYHNEYSEILIDDVRVRTTNSGD